MEETHLGESTGPGAPPTADEREAALADREAKVREAELAEREAEMTRREQAAVKLSADHPLAGTRDDPGVEDPYGHLRDRAAEEGTKEVDGE